MVTRNDLESHLAALLQVERFRDYGPNGLQVEGGRAIHKIASGVTASLALIAAAAEWGADAIVVHHGLFWRGQDGCVVGWMQRRLKHLLSHDISLFAYHLPLDAHAELGNNAQFARRLGLQADARFGEQDLGAAGPANALDSLESLRAALTDALGREPTVVAGDGRALRRIGWCTGGAQGYFESAIAAGVDAFVTGEISEPQAHIARETGVAFLACGHHASERYGVAALGEHLAAAFGLEHRFFEIANPA